jgi:hypothetical protein
MNDDLIKRMERIALAAGDVVSPQEFVAAIKTLTGVLKKHQAEVNEEIRGMQKIIDLFQKKNDITSYRPYQDLMESVDSVKSDLKKVKERPAAPDKIIERTEVLKPVVTTKIIEKALKDSPEELVTKVNKSSTKISKNQIDGIEALDEIPELKKMTQQFNAVPVTTTHFYQSGAHKGRAKNINIQGGGTVSIAGDTANINITASSGSGHVIQDEGVPLPQRANLNFSGVAVTVTDDILGDVTNVTITAMSETFSTPTGAVNGSNVTYTVASIPLYIVADGATYFEGAGYSRATLTITMDVAPSSFIRAKL